jgi:O-acetyl-ADP-ribose deacetylase (regulator of RNase III)
MARLEVIQGDITTFNADAIVNAANSQLQHGGGVAAAISKAAGPELQAFCYNMQTVDTGDAVVTPGFNLPAKFVVHAVGPIWQGGSNGEPAQLFKAYYRAAQVAAEAGAKTIAFPSISTGIYGYPIEDAAELAVAALLEALADFLMIEKITIVTFSDADYAIFSDAVEGLFD